MDVSFVAPGQSADALVLALFSDRRLCAAAQELDAATGGALTRALEAGRARGKAGDIVEVLGLAPEAAPYARVLLVGFGDADKAAKAAERAVAGAVRHLLRSGATSLHVRLDDEAFGVEGAAGAALGARLASYRYETYKTKTPEHRKASLVEVSFGVNDSEACARADLAGAAVAQGVIAARDFVNAPPNAVYPESYADAVANLNIPGLEVEVFDEAQMEELGMNALLGVGRGSRRASRMVVMRWSGGGEEAPLALIGKGVTFDTGGISLKPGAGLDEMRGDMGGSAAVVGAMISLAARKAKANVVGLVGLVENMPDGDAQLPGDIVTSMSGQTIEILNTDAEGRLVLCDVLWYARTRFEPRAMIDLATLTGAVVLTFANEFAGLFSNDDTLADQITKAAAAVDEPVWRLPLTPAYDKMIDTPNADMKNIGGREAGSITAAQFLARHVDGATWAHLDIASTAWKSKNTDPRTPGWATGYGVRLLDRLVADNFES